MYCITVTVVYDSNMCSYDLKVEVAMWRKCFLVLKACFFLSSVPGAVVTVLYHYYLHVQYIGSAATAEYHQDRIE